MQRTASGVIIDSDALTAEVDLLKDIFDLLLAHPAAVAELWVRELIDKGAEHCKYRTAAVATIIVIIIRNERRVILLEMFHDGLLHLQPRAQAEQE